VSKRRKHFGLKAEAISLLSCYAGTQSINMSFSLPDTNVKMFVLVLTIFNEDAYI